MEIASEYRALVASIEQGDVDAGVVETERLIAAGQSAQSIFEDAIVPFLKDLGDRFGRLELYLPDLILAAAVVKAVQPVLKDHAQVGTMGAKGRVVIGTVYGDVHDIGKNVVAAMLEADGFEVHDLGTNVSAQEFVKRARDLKADIVAMSALLSTTMPYMADGVSLIRENPADSRQFKVLVGGGPVTEEYATRIGADAYGRNAAEAVVRARALLDRP
jgi:methanogenic corrinoid protein MtbC1